MLLWVGKVTGLTVLPTGIVSDGVILGCGLCAACGGKR
jgi:hypothetical protein